MLNRYSLFTPIVATVLFAGISLRPALGNQALPLGNSAIQNKKSLTFENTAPGTYAGIVRSSAYLKAIEDHIALETPRDKVYSLAFCKCDYKLGTYAVAYVKQDKSAKRAVEACFEVAAPQGGCLSKPEVVAITSEGASVEKVAAYPKISRTDRVKKNVPYLFERASLYQQKGDFASALIHIDKILEIDPNNYVAALRGGWLSTKLRRYEEAMSHYRRASKLKPDSLEARIGLLGPLVATRRWKDVRSTAAAVLKIAPKNYSALAAQSKALEALGEKDEARQIAQVIAEAYPIHYRLAKEKDPIIADHFTKSVQFEKQGRLAAALDEVLKIIQVDPDHYAGNLRAGWLYYQLQDYYSSIRSYRKAAKSAPRALEPLEGLLPPLIAQKRWAEAVPPAEKALKVDPNNYTAASCLAYAKFSLGKYGSAARQYKRMLRLYPSQTDMQLGWGWTLYKLGRVDVAHKWFSEVLKVNPGDRKAIEGLHAVVTGL